jgi:hypothetical protein
MMQLTMAAANHTSVVSDAADARRSGKWGRRAEMGAEGLRIGKIDNNIKSSVTMIVKYQRVLSDTFPLNYSWPLIYGRYFQKSN